MCNVSRDEVLSWFPDSRIIGDLPESFSDVSATVAEGHGNEWAFMPISHIFEHDIAADIRAAREAGASAVIVNAADYCETDNFPAILTNGSAWDAFTQLATRRRNAFRGVVIGVTGSAGKTTTRSFTAAFCRGAGETVETFENSGHDAGIRLCETRLHGGCKYGVVEMGIYAPHQMKLHTRQLKPNVAILTSIGSAHVGNFKSRMQLAREKAKVFDRLYGEHQIGVVSRDMPEIELVRSMAHCNLVEVSMQDATASFYGVTADTNSGELKVIEKETGLTTTLSYGRPGKHICYDVLLAFAAARSIGVSPEQCLQGLQTVSVPGCRWRKTIRSGIVYIDDSFNANRESMLGVLDILKQMKGRRIAVLGDMLEQGELSDAHHQQVGYAAAYSNLDALIVYGHYATTSLADTYDDEISRIGHGLKACRAKSISEVKAYLAELAKEGDTVCLKASNAMNLSKVLE